MMFNKFQLALCSFLYMLGSVLCFTPTTFVCPRSPLLSSINSNRITSSSSGSSSGSSSTTAIYSTYKKANGKSQHSRDQNDDRTELNRTKLLLSQARGDLQESEMRATAAEHRVARLQLEMKNLNQKAADESKAEGEEDSELTENAKKDLENKVFDLKKSLQELNEKMQNEIKKLQSINANERSEFERREKELQNDLDKAKSEHKKALQEVSNLKGKVEKLDNEMKRIELKATKEIDELKASHDKAMTSMQMDALEVQSNLEMVNSNLETKLMDEKQHSEQLLMEIRKIQKESAEEIQSIKHKADVDLGTMRKDLALQKNELADRNEQIEELHKERSRVRTLAKIQLGLVKTRIAKRYRKIFRRDAK